jgi:5'-nucleotidase
MNLLNFESVLLDMDGTLLDSHFDDLFWNNWVAKAYAVKNGLPLSHAKQHVQSALRAVAGDIVWYDFDHWADHFGLDLESLQESDQSLIRCRPGTLALLDYLTDHSMPMILATNAHPKVLAFKLKTIRAKHPKFTAYFSDIITSHRFGSPKEAHSFWQQFTKQTGINPARTALIDDNAKVLDAAKAYGIAGLIAISQPNSNQPPQSLPGYENVCYLNELITE